MIDTVRDFNILNLSFGSNFVLVVWNPFRDWLDLSELPNKLVQTGSSYKTTVIVHWLNQLGTNLDLKAANTQKPPGKQHFNMERHQHFPDLINTVSELQHMSQTTGTTNETTSNSRWRRERSLAPITVTSASTSYKAKSNFQIFTIHITPLSKNKSHPYKVT